MTPLGAGQLEVYTWGLRRVVEGTSWIAVLQFSTLVLARREKLMG